MGIKKVFACATLLTCSVLTNQVQAESSVWKISKGDNYFYLGGTVHLLTPEDHPLPEEFNQAYKDVSKVVFETDLAATETPEFQSKMFAAFTYPDERTLASELKPEVYAKLQAFLAARQMPISNFSKLKPGGLSLMLAMMEYQRLGMTPEYGVDAFFNQLAVSDSKNILGLESPEQQLSFLESMINVEPNTGIEYTLRDLTKLPEIIHSLKQSWRSGDLDALSETLDLAKVKTEFPEVYEALITNRNNNWMTQLPLFLEDSPKEFVLVGAMHLNGKEGLLHQLKQQGFEVKKL